MHGRFQRVSFAPEGFVIASIQSIGEDIQILL